MESGMSVIDMGNSTSWLSTTPLAQGKNFRVQSHDDATWILSSAFVVFTMQSGVSHSSSRPHREQSQYKEKMAKCESSGNLGIRSFGVCSTDDPASDSVWILTSTFIILTMQSGFGLLESGSVSSKNEVNIMVKNAVDVICGGITYWMFGYGLSFGEDERFLNPFSGWGDFFVTADEESLGYVYAKFFFQASFATTATTIVSGAMAERTKLEAYIIFSLLNTFVYCFPAHWFWGKSGWLQDMGVIDIAGAGPVHVVGGVTGLVSTMILKPRHNRFKRKRSPQMGSPTNALLGMFMLWWGWLGFNCGSTFGISGMKWKLAARSAVSTICASTAGGIVGLVLSYIVKKRQFDVGYLINSILGSLVGITATCAIAHPWEGLLIGVVGACLTILGITILEKLNIDDPVGCVGVHAVGGSWSLLAAGFVVRKDSFAKELQLTQVHNGLFHGGGFYQLGIQALAVVTLIVWTTVSSFLFLKTIELVIGLRVPLEEELLGADLIEHGIGRGTYDKVSKKVVYDDDDDDEIMTSGWQSTTHCLGKHIDKPERPDFTQYPSSNRKLAKINYFMKKRFKMTVKLNKRTKYYKECVDGNENIFRNSKGQNGCFLYEDYGMSSNNFNKRYYYNGPRCNTWGRSIYGYSPESGELATSA